MTVLGTQCLFLQKNQVLNIHQIARVDKIVRKKLKKVISEYLWSICLPLIKKHTGLFFYSTNVLDGKETRKKDVPVVTNTVLTAAGPSNTQLKDLSELRTNNVFKSKKKEKYRQHIFG